MLKKQQIVDAIIKYGDEVFVEVYRESKPRFLLRRRTDTQNSIFLGYVSKRIFYWWKFRKTFTEFINVEYWLLENTKPNNDDSNPVPGGAVSLLGML